MPIIVIDKERDFAAVAARVLTSRASKAAQTAAISALRAANPGLDPERLQPGTLVVVPPLTGGRATIAGGHEEAVPSLVGEVRAALDGLADAFEQQAADDQRERDQTLELLASGELKQASARDPDLHMQISDLTKAVRADIKAAEGEPERWRAAIETWTADLDALRQARPPK
jgi:hypothetical protein